MAYDQPFVYRVCCLLVLWISVVGFTGGDNPRFYASLIYVSQATKNLRWPESRLQP